MIHEMLHNLGVGHEQNRPDRDTLMDIDWTNIPIDKVMMRMMSKATMMSKTTMMMMIFGLNRN